MIFEEIELKGQGFEIEYKGEKEVNGEYVPDEKSYRYAKGFISVERDGDEQIIYVRSRITFSEDYSRPVIGVKTKQDLIDLCRLVNGDNVYTKASIYTVLFDLVDGNGIEEVFTMLHNVASDLEQRKELEDKFNEAKTWEWS